ncbi:hypothetical protein WR25_08205 isoform D [Diploscapter pachys]|uniref:RING-type domain-containing protein n=1 Tax=Diploscapter pachys TaxID=2018661 RepID=A0A2A2JCZ2_9BILA|nr:hypothetical protein WR25_08205 isoform B [Diploscapter pachys]PAV59620.1 hypothetical protein WR25_08205 isoform D [Diploscapter pachys]
MFSYMEKKTPMILSKNDVLRIEVALKKELLSIRWRLNEEHFCDRRVVQLGKMLEVPRFYIAASGDTIRITTPEDYLLQRINPNLSLITSYCNVCFVKGRKMVHPECGHLVCITCYFIYRKIRVSKNENAICSFCNLVWNEDKMSSVVYRETFCPIDRCRADAERDPTRYVMNPCGCVLLCMPENGEKPAVCPFEFCKENIAGDERKVFA